MREVIANLIGTGADSVSVVASSGNLSGPEGAGRVIRATALVTISPR
jgi:2C-methyl-D-erythritol 2,4-cyclodiphosphate synthase